MALIDKASLLMVPSTYEAGKLYNVLPSGNRAPDNKGGAGYDQTRADFDFDRGSNAAATRIGSDGLLKKYRENKLLQSNQFDTTWLKVNASLTSGQSGYNGTSDAWLLSATDTFANVYQSISQTGLVTFSVYAKAGSGNWMMMRLNGSTNNLIYIDLANQVFGGTSAQYVDGTITDLGSGWRRVSVTINQTSYNNAHIYVAADDLDLNTTNETIYIQNAQLESGLVSTDYLDSTSVTGKAGVLVDLPRINFDANGENGNLLLEPSRANLVQFSEYFSTASGYWINVRSTIETNSTTSPEGLNNASKILQDSTTTNAGVIVKSITASGSNTFSFFAKKGSVNFARLSLNSGTETSAYFDLENGEVGTTNSISESDCFIEDMGNDWYRCGATYSGATNRFNIYLGDRDGITTLLDASNAYIYIYGAQWEASASYPSSYIPNHGESGGVTRAADVCSVTGVSDAIGQTEGTIYWEGIAQPNDNPILVQLIPSAAGNYTNTIYLEYVHSSTEFKVQAWDTGVKQVQINTGAVTAGQVYKLAFAYKVNDFALYMNGTQIGTDTSGSVQSGLDKIGLGSLNGTTNAAFYGSEAKQAALFKERLSNAELATLTTL